MKQRDKLTEKTVRAAEPRAKSWQMFDSEVLGLSVCIYASGSRSFMFDYRSAGRQRRYTMGRWPNWSVTAARDRARELRRLIDTGIDPMADREDARDAPRITDLIDRYLEEHAVHLAPRYRADQESMMRKLVAPHWQNKLVTEIEPADVERDRFLSLAEIGRLSDALSAAEDQRGATIIRLCMLTGARVGEVRAARFDEFDLPRGAWAKPAIKTKQRRIHRVPISAEAAALVRLRQDSVPAGCAWLFPGDADKDQPVQEIRRFWRDIQTKADLPGVRIHDLHHTFASLLVIGGASLEMIGKLLGHSQARTTQRYAHLMDSPLRASVDAVAGMMRARPRLVQPTPSADGATSLHEVQTV